MRVQIALIDFTPTPELDEERLTGLIESIKEKGLSQAIVLRPPNELGRYPLASGEKRLVAHNRLGLTEIEAEVRELTEQEAEELRLHENIKRFDLTWWEAAEQHERLHVLRQTQHGTPVRTGRPPKDEAPKPKVGWSLADTAKELNIGVGSLSEDLGLARAIRNDATLKKVKDRKTALRLAKNAIARNTAELEAGLPTAFEANEVYLGDSADILRQLETASINHCITDPPWIKFFEPTLRIDDRTLPVFRELYRVLKHGAFLYVICGLDDLAYYAGTTRPDPSNPSEVIHERGELEKIGFSVSNTPVIWEKENSLSRRGVRPWEYDRDFEFIIVAVKGAPALTTSRRLSGIKKYAIVPPVKMIHPNEKPIDLIMDIIEDCSYEGNIIIDPFGGSGVTAEACKKMNRKYIVCERDHKTYERICKRLGVKR